jgi:hypothetical protein
MKKDRIPNLLRWKCSCLELNIYRPTAGAGILLRLGRSHCAGADGDSKQASWQFLHDRSSSVPSTVLANKETSLRNILVQQHLQQSNPN